MAKKQKYTTEDHEEWVRLYDEEMMSYQKIADRYGTNKVTIGRGIKKIKEGSKKKPGPEPTPKDVSAEMEKISNVELSRRKKLRDSAYSAYVYKRAPIIVDGIINAINGYQYTINSVQDVFESTDDQLNGTVDELAKLNENVQNFNTTDPEDSAFKFEQERLFEQINETLLVAKNTLGKTVSLKRLQLSCAAELRKQMESYFKIKVDIEGFQKVTMFLDAFFVATDVLDDKTYEQFRDKVVEIAPAARELFAAREQKETELEID